MGKSLSEPKESTGNPDEAHLAEAAKPHQCGGNYPCGNCPSAREIAEAFLFPWNWKKEFWDGSLAQHFAGALVEFVKDPLDSRIPRSVPLPMVNVPSHPHPFKQIGEETFPHPDLRMAINGPLLKRIFLSCPTCGKTGSYIEDRSAPVIELEPEADPNELQLPKALRQLVPKKVLEYFRR